MKGDIDETVELRRRIDRRAFQQTCSWAVASRSLVIAIIVGTVLNAINQGPDLLAGKPVNVPKLILTYAVPFFVSSFGAYSAFRQKSRHESSADKSSLMPDSVHSQS